MSDGRTPPRELALLFLRLCATAFGGPAAHVAMMQDEVVRRRGGGPPRNTSSTSSARPTSSPGPTPPRWRSTSGGSAVAGRGCAVAGVAFILPATLITAALGWVYARYGTVPSARWLLYGVKPVILAVVAQALWGLAPRAARTTRLRLLGAAATGLAAFGGHELAILFGAGAVSLLSAARPTPEAGTAGRGLFPMVPLVPLAGRGGALVATAGIFLPAFVFVALSGPLIPRLRASPRAAAFLDGVNVASLALMAVVAAQLGRAAPVDVPTVILAAVSAALLVRWKVNSTWLVLGGAALGCILHAAR